MISENIVKFFGGMIAVRSKFGKGSKFAFFFLLDKPKVGGGEIHQDVTY